jgi:hypothetical protein
MNVAAASPARRESRLPLLIVLSVLAAALLWYLQSRLNFLTLTLASYTAYFWPRRLGLLPHLVGGVLASTTGLAQIWLGLTNRTGSWHHALGRIYGTGVLVGSLGGYYMVLTIPGNDLAYSSGLFMMSTAWALTTGMALYAVRHRQLEQHREWMLRSYVVTFAFVTIRLTTDLLRSWLGMPAAESPDHIDDMMAWACWSVPLLLAEPLIQMRSLRRESGRDNFRRD